MEALMSLAFLSSLILRLSAYVFLRWLPIPACLPLIAILYFTYLLSSAFSCTPERRVQKTQLRASSATKDELGSNILVEKSAKIATSESKVLLSIIFGAPSPSWKVNLGAWTINTILLLFTFDFAFRSRYFYPSEEISFIRLGHITCQSAKLTLRDPFAHNFSLKYRVEGEAEWMSIPAIKSFSEETDFVQSVMIDGLLPASKYAYVASNNISGHFTTPSRRSRGTFSFVTSSCIKARFPYTPLQHPLHMRGFTYLASALNLISPSFMMFLGDFIYVDVPKRFGNDMETYRREYRQVYGSPEWQGVNKIPWIHVYDDHEILNDYDVTKNQYNRFENAIDDAFKIYQHESNPPALQSTYYTFERQGAAFFMLDTRRYRDDESMPDSPNKTMLGLKQKADLIAWLEIPRAWKIVVSSVPFTKNWHNKDTWSGYLFERKEILQAMHRVGGVVVLSGDRHEHATTRFPPPKDALLPISHSVYEYSTSPLSQFYLPLPTYRQVDEEDELIQYIPNGNSKFGHIEIDTTDDNQPRLSFTLYIDGKAHWQHRIAGPAFKLPETHGVRGKWTWAALDLM